MFVTCLDHITTRFIGSNTTYNNIKYMEKVAAAGV